MGDKAMSFLNNKSFHPGNAQNRAKIFEAEVKKKNASPLGKLNDGAVLSQASTERALLCNFLARLDNLSPTDPGIDPSSSRIDKTKHCWSEA